MPKPTENSYVRINEKKVLTAVRLPEPKLVTNRPYKHDRAMQEAARRSADHPKPISMSTRVRDF